MAQAGQIRQEENTNFQKTVADQITSIKVLNSALEVLKQTFEKPEDLMQVAAKSSEKSSEKPENFERYEQNTGGDAVLTLIRTIIGDTEAAKEASVTSENAAQAAYEKSMKGSNDSKAAKEEELNTFRGAKADLSKSIEAQTLENADNESLLSSKSTYLATKQEECKFLMDNFTVRQEGQGAEIEALQEAKSFLKGMV